jgi:hypothetical protein
MAFLKEQPSESADYIVNQLDRVIEVCCGGTVMRTLEDAEKYASGCNVNFDTESKRNERVNKVVELSPGCLLVHNDIAPASCARSIYASNTARRRRDALPAKKGPDLYPTLRKRHSFDDYSHTPHSYSSLTRRRLTIAFNFTILVNSL